MLNEEKTTASVGTLTAWEYDSALERGETFLAEFFAERCSHCKAMEPVLERFAAEHPELAVYRIDADNEPALTVRSGVRQLPTVILYRDGKEVGRQSGAMRYPELSAFASEERV